MAIERRKFLAGALAAIAGGIARALGLGAAAAAAPSAAAAVPVAAAATAGAAAAAAYGSGVRAQVFEVIVRQALAGAPWRKICTGPMQVNNISEEEVTAEVERRKRLLNHKCEGNCRVHCEKCAETIMQKNKQFMDTMRNLPHTNEPGCACHECLQIVRGKIARLQKEIMGDM